MGESAERGRETPGSVALRIAAALDRYLPLLNGSSTVGTGAGCDVVDRLPYLCVASTADNVHTEDAALLIDLGGKDTYRNGAGAAPFPAGEEMIGVSVSIDLGGDDVYESPPPRLPGFVLAQGAGDFGALGMLVDLGGDDRYRASASTTATSVVAQGSGLAGAGFLFDLGGSDVYVAEGLDGPAGVFLFAQAGAAFCAASQDPPGGGCSAGALFDAGIGNDRYEVLAGEATGAGQRYLLAQAATNFGTAVLSDDGGSDLFRATAAAATVDADSYPAGAISCPGGGSFATVCLNVQGTALGAGEALLLEGVGATRYEALAPGRGTIWALVRAQGVSVGTPSILEDLGGDDSYVVRSVVAHSRDLTVGPCADGETCPTERTVSGEGLEPIALSAQGMGQSPGGMGALVDAAGNDTYSIEARTSLEGVLRDTRPSAEEAAGLSAVGYRWPEVETQGAGGVYGSGTLLDASGNDAYRVTVTNDVKGEGVPTAGRPAPVADASLVGRDTNLIQGGGDLSGSTGALVDAGGIGDRFDVVSSGSAVALPDPARARMVGGAWPRVQGTYGGVFAALGVTPVVTSSPSRTICRISPGRRGFGAWQDCALSSDDPEYQSESAIPVYSHHSFGTAPSALGRAPTLAVTAESVKDGFVEVEGVLRDPDGAAIASSPVIFTLQYGCTLLCLAQTGAAGTYWGNAWEVVATTDATGTARASVPVDLAPLKLGTTPYSYRVQATYDGAAGLYPRHAAAPVSIPS